MKTLALWILSSLACFGQLGDPAFVGSLAPAPSGLSYLLYDTFTTPQSAPLTSPRTCEPGPGGLTLTDAGNALSISSGNLLFGGTTSGNTGFIPTNTFTRAAGLAASYNFGSIANEGLARFGWAQYGLGSTIENGAYFASPTSLQVRESTFTTAGLSFSAPGTLIFVLRSSGFFCINASHLIWVGNSSTVATLDPILWMGGGQTPSLSLQDFKILQMATWSSDANIATSISLTPTSGDTATMTADAIVDFTWTPATSEIAEIQFRRVDDNNTFIVRCDQALSSINLIKKDTGTETDLPKNAGTTNQTWTVSTAYRITIRTIGTTIKTYVNGGLRNDPSAQTFNQTSTGVKVTGFTTGGPLYCWPYDVSSKLSSIFYPTYQTVEFTAIGDSKTVNDNWIMWFKPYISSEINGNWVESPSIMAQAGRNVMTENTAVDAELAARGGSPSYLFFNLGANDVNGDSGDVLYDGTGDTWKTRLAYILDAVHTKWPACKVYLMRAGKVGDATIQSKLNLIDDTLIEAVIATRSSWCFLGPDERVFLENGDNYATYTSDGMHPNTAGYQLTAMQWKSTIGF